MALRDVLPVDSVRTTLPPDHCPFCGRELDVCSSLEPGAMPSPGDLTLCVTCGGVMQFDGALRHVPMTDAALAACTDGEKHAIAEATRLILLARGV